MDIVEIQNRIQESLPLWYPGLTGPNTYLLFIHKKQYRWSQHLVFRMNGVVRHEGQGILVKCLKSHDTIGGLQNGIRSAQHGALLEYKALSLLYDHLGKGQLDGVRAVRCLAHFADMDAVVMEYTSGRTLMSLALEAAKPWAKESAVKLAADAAGRVGKLVAGLHQIKRDKCPRTEPFDAGAYYEDLQAEVDNLLSFSVSETVRTWLNNVLQMVRKFTRGLKENVVVAYLHNDLYLDNFIVLPDGHVCTIDTTLEWTGPVEKDIGQLIVFAETSKQRLLGGAAAVRTRVINRMTQAFLANYSDFAHYSSRILILYRLLALVQCWSRFLDVCREKSTGLIMSLFQRVRLNPFMLGYLDSICNHFRKEFCNE
ncbi:hypothetical protein ES703_71333 [subsurface metagenome]